MLNDISRTDKVPFDIIYKIYFYIDDYCTANNFLLLCKDFYNNFMKNKAYHHKFTILYENLFSFLMLLPETLDNRGDLSFYELLMCQSKNYQDRIMLHKDIYFVYNLYKNFFIYYFANDNKRLTIANNLSNIIILQGPTFINNLVKLEFNGKKVSIKSKFKKRSEMFGYILEHYNKYNLKLIEYQIQYLTVDGIFDI